MLCLMPGHGGKKVEGKGGEHELKSVKKSVYCILAYKETSSET